jgi:hypothetical protein
MRTVQSIETVCAIQIVETTGRDYVRIRFREMGENVIDPTDFELEGNPVLIAEMLSCAASCIIGSISSTLGEA